MRYPKIRFLLNTFLVVIALAFAPSVLAAKYKVLHAFSGTPDGGGPFAPLAIDGHGNLYGTTWGGGKYGYGAVFEVSPGGGDWTETILHSFCPDWPQCSDGGAPMIGVTLDAAGNLYGPTATELFQVTPEGDHWAFHVIYETGTSEVLFDSSGNIYTESGPGKCSQGEILKLIPPRNGGDWTAKDLYDFCRHKKGQGSNPNYGLSWDTAGNLYGVAGGGKENQGLVFQLEHTPTGWKQHVLHEFHYLNQDANGATGPPVADSAGNLYGSTQFGGSDRCGGPGCGTIYKLSKQPDGRWKETLLFKFPKWSKSGHPLGTLAMDAAGNLYGVAGGSLNECSCGVVFKFVHNPNDTWTYTILHRFHGTDGAYPQAGVTLDAEGSIYGTTVLGGEGGAGVVFKITQ
jgi:uncharacterized repeat protein (TIGR03803 family)